MTHEVEAVPEAGRRAFDDAETLLLDSKIAYFLLSRTVTLRSSERHQLKQDQFAVKTQETLDWAAEHQNALLYWTVGIVLLIAIAAGGFYYQQHREQTASVLLSAGLEQYQAPIRPANMPAVPGEPSFTSASDRAKAASTKFIEVSQKYNHTDAGTLAKYFLGLASQDMNDNAKAEEYFKDVAESGNKDTAALAKEALAGLYRDEGRQRDAIKLYQELIDKPTNTVPKAVAQLDLANLYQTSNNPAEAKKIYADVVKDKSNSDQIIGMANTRLAELK